MTSYTKQTSAFVGILLGMVLALYGLGRIVNGGIGQQNDQMLRGVIFLVIGVAGSLVAAVLRTYYRSADRAAVERDKVAVETLASMAAERKRKQ